MRTEDEAKVELQKHLKKLIRDDVWNYLVKHRFVSEYLNGFGDIQTLAEEYRDLDGHFQRNSRREHISRELPPDNRSEALSEVISCEASRLPAVVEFRKQHLRGHLVSVDNWTSWLKRKAAKEEPEESEEPNLCVPISYGRKLLVRAEDCVVFHHLDVSRIDPETFRPEYINVAAKRGGVVDALLATAQEVMETFRPAFDLQRSVVLILTGEARLPRGIAEVPINDDFKSLSRIRLDIDPRMKPKEVQDYYSEVRKSFLSMLYNSDRDRVMSEKHLQLATFIAREYSPEQAWIEIVGKWNSEYPEWKYPKTDTGKSNFARDVKASWERVTGQSWAVKRGAR
jgi:hypothetical protein